VHGLIRGTPPLLDLAREAALQKLLVSLASAGLPESAHDCSEGGLGVALAECCFDAGFGATVDVEPVATEAGGGFVEIETIFGESASRVIVSISEKNVAEVLARASRLGVPAATIGQVGGDSVRVAIAGRAVIDDPVGQLESVWTSAIEDCFERGRAIA
jgi:phosphoribosylformylglycinamidine (FGAM) synthase-like enzyme